MPRGDAATGARRVVSAERREQVFDLRKQGRSFKEIARETSLSVGTAHKIVTRELGRIKERTAESVEIVRTMEVQRLDAMLAALWPFVTGTARQSAEAGDEEEASGPSLLAIDRALRIMERRARMLGLDAAPAVIRLRVGDSVMSISCPTAEAAMEVARIVGDRMAEAGEKETRVINVTLNDDGPSFGGNGNGNGDGEHIQ